MAIQFNLVSDSGPTYPTAYANLQLAELIKTKAGFDARCVVNIYAEAQYRTAGKKPLSVEARVFAGADPAQPLLAQLYTKLKAMQKYAGAIDV